MRILDERFAGREVYAYVQDDGRIHISFIVPLDEAVTRKLSSGQHEAPLPLAAHLADRIKVMRGER
jgi:hypothetical protein